MPYTQFNGATFPASDPHITSAAPPATNQAAALAFVQAYVPNTWEGSPVNFYQTFTGTVTCADAYPNGGCQSQLLPGMDLEMWGLPTSMPAVDPNNHNFIYQRFQRGVMMYDASNGTTNGVLFGQYLKAILTGIGLPSDLYQESRDSNFWLQCWPGMVHWIRGGTNLMGTNLAGAFSPDMFRGSIQSQLGMLNACQIEQLGFIEEFHQNLMTDVQAGQIWAANPHVMPPYPADCFTIPTIPPPPPPYNSPGAVAAQFLIDDGLIIPNPQALDFATVAPGVPYIPG